jgi:CHAT domain-containing protein/Tfp pilus assembly protein PilF
MIEWEEKVERLNEQAVEFIGRGMYRQALLRASQALTLSHRYLPEDNDVIAQSLNNTALAYKGIADFARAEQCFLRTLMVLDVEWSEMQATVRDNLGGLYLEMGDYSLAEILLQQSLEIRRMILSAQDPDIALSFNNVAALRFAMGDYADAENLYHQALRIYREVFPAGDDPHTATVLNNLGQLHAAIGNYSLAGACLRRALEIRRELPHAQPHHVAQSLDNLGMLYQRMGNHASVAPLYEEALAIRRKVLPEQHPEIGRNLNNLAAFFQEMGEYDKAELRYEEALEILQIKLGAKHPDVALILSNLGNLNSEKGSYDRAEELLHQSLTILQNYFISGHPDLAICFRNLGKLSAATGRHRDALQFVQEAVTIDEHTLGQVFAIGSERQRLAYLATLRVPLYSYLSLVVGHLADDPAVLSSAFDLVLRRKAIGAEALAAQREAILSGRYPELAPQLHRLRVLRAQVAQLTLAGPGSENPAAYQERLANWDAERESLESVLASQIPEMDLAQRLRAADRQAVADHLPPGSCLVEFVYFRPFDFTAVPARGESYWQPPHYLAFVLAAGEPDAVQLIDLGPAEAIDRLLRDALALLSQPPAKRPARDLGPWPEGTSRPAPSDAGDALRAQLFDPLRPALGHAQRLFLAPDGALTQLPFEVLPDGEGARLLDHYAISYLSIGRDMLRFGLPPTQPPGEALVVADPDYDLRGTDGQPAAEESGGEVPRGRVSRDLERDRRFDRLSGTRQEGKEIACRLGVSAWLDARALEQPLKAVRSPRVLHLATHGFFLPDQPDDPASLTGLELARGGGAGAFDRLLGLRLENPLLRSGLALAGANTWRRGLQPPSEAEDGILTAEEVTGMDLTDTELVVLSACQTGVGQVLAGEGVFGLRRAVVLAGANALVMSLWSVPDAETQQLMASFYERLFAGAAGDAALRDAQHARREKQPDPYYWGAFIYQGDPQPLRDYHPATSAATTKEMTP